jgi:uncharacterized membrane protein
VLRFRVPRRQVSRSRQIFVFRDVRHGQPPPPDAASVVARRNLSLAPRQRWTVYGALAAGSLAMAIGFVAAGVWPVLPYSILELAALAAAFAWIERRSNDSDSLTLDGDRVVVEQRRAGARRGASSRGTGCASRSTRNDGRTSRGSC